MDARATSVANIKWQLSLLRADEKRLRFLISCPSTTVGTRTRAVTQLPYVRERLQILEQELSRMESEQPTAVQQAADSATDPGNDEIKLCEDVV